MHDDRFADSGGVIGGEHQRASVLEALDVRRDHPDVGLIEEVTSEVGELEVGFVAGGRPVRQGDALILRLEDRTTLVPALGDQRDLEAGQIVAERLERVQVGVGTEQVCVAGGDQVLEALLQSLAFGADLVETGGEDDGEPWLLLEHGLEHLDGLADEDDRQVEIAGNIGDRGVALHAVDLVLVRIHRIDRGARVLTPGTDLPPHGGVGSTACVGRADHGDALRVEEDVEIEIAQGGRAAGDVERCLGHGRDPT